MDAYAVGLMREVLEAAVELGALARQPLEPLTHVLLAALHEAALYVARADDHAAARAERRGHRRAYLARTGVSGAPAGCGVGRAPSAAGTR